MPNQVKKTVPYDAGRIIRAILRSFLSATSTMRKQCETAKLCCTNAILFQVVVNSPTLSARMRPALIGFIVTALLFILPSIHSYNVGRWRFRGHPISFDRASSSNNHDENPVLLLNGFGVGSFHQHRLLNELVPKHPNRVFYAMDYLGQGKSCNNR